MMTEIVQRPLESELSRVGRYQELESVINEAIGQIYVLAVALKEIRDDKHYQDLGFKTFEDYCQDRWNLGRSYVHRCIDFAVTVNLLPMGNKNADPVIVQREIDKRGLSERSLRPIASSGLPDEQKAVLVEAVVTAEEKPTARAVSKVVKEFKLANDIPLYVNKRTGQEPEFSPIIKPSDNWNFSNVAFERLEENDHSHGYIPGDIYANCLWYYTSDGARVAAPMAGSGQIIKVWESRAQWMVGDQWEIDLHCFDLSPRGRYADRIQRNDLRHGLPIQDVDYIVMDIPYYGMVVGQYSDSPDDVANMNLDYWLDAMSRVARSCAAAQVFTGLCSVVTPNYRDVVSGQIIPVTSFVEQVFVGAGYVLHDKAYASRRIQQAQNAGMARMNSMAKKNKVMLTDMAEILTFALNGG